MQINEIIVGGFSGFLMLPLSIITAVVIKNFFALQATTAIKLTFIIAISITLIAHSPMMYIWKYHIIEITPLRHGVALFFVSHWAVAVAAIMVGIRYSFRNTSLTQGYSITL